MNGAHLHLVVTHLPVLGAAFASVLLGIGLWKDSRALQQTALTVLVLTGITAGVAFWTGEGAEEAIERQLGSGQSLVERHEEAGMVGLIMAGLTGGLALLVLLSGMKGRRLSRFLAAANLLLGLATSGTLAWVANLGGQIGHPEIRADQAAAEEPEESPD